MPSVSTGAILGNHTMLALGVSGDGDTASIGMGQFVHLLRRNLPMIYIIEITAYMVDEGAVLGDCRYRLQAQDGRHQRPAADRHLLACHSVGRDLCWPLLLGDKKQLLAMLKAAIAHKGTVMLDVISPCVTSTIMRVRRRATIHAGA